MSRISGKINLTDLVSVLTSRKGKDGKMIEGVFIPIENNNLFKSDKGNVYMDFTSFPLKSPKEGGDTHVVKLSVPKDLFEAMTDDQKSEIPLIGNIKVWEGGAQEKDVPETGPEDDLPF